MIFRRKGEEDSERVKCIEDAGLEVTYYSRWKEYDIRLKDYEDYKKHKELIDNLVKESMEYYNLI